MQHKPKLQIRVQVMEAVQEEKKGAVINNFKAVSIFFKNK